MSSHSFFAYIDESGDEGFVFKEPPERASSEWFVLGACVLRATNLEQANRTISEEFRRQEQNRKKPVLHLTDIQHEARIPLLHKISNVHCRTVVICINKKALQHPESFKGSRRLYFYSTRYLVERISWLVRDSRVTGEGDGRCKLVFSRCKHLSYEQLKEYLSILRADPSGDVRIEWNAIDHENISVFEHKEKTGLRMADAVSSGIAKALELSPHGYCEDRYVRILRPTIYNRPGGLLARGRKNYLSYGLKFLPAPPATEPARENRYAWIESFK